MKTALLSIAAILAGSGAAVASTVPIPIEEFASSKNVRAFMEAVNFNRWQDVAPMLAEDIVIISEGVPWQGRDAAAAWARSFGEAPCGFLRRSDPGHLNDNSIVYGQDGKMIEVRPVYCLAKPNPGNLTGDQRGIIRFTSALNGPIERIEILK